MPVWGPLACAQPEVTIVPLEEGLSSYRRTQRSVSKCSLRPSGNAQLARSLPHPCTAVCTAPPLLLHFRRSSNLWLFESALLNSRQVKEAETFFLQTRNEGDRNSFIPVLYKWVISDFYSRPHFCLQHLTSVLTLNYPQSLTCAFLEITFSNMIQSSQFNTFLFQDLRTVMLVHF